MRILLVEDEPNAARILAKGLREEAYAVDVAQDGEGALEQISINDYDLIILDVMLPRKNGFEVCRQLRAGGSAVPVLMLTARDALEIGSKDSTLVPTIICQNRLNLRSCWHAFVHCCAGNLRFIAMSWLSPTCR